MHLPQRRRLLLRTRRLLQHVTPQRLARPHQRRPEEGPRGGALYPDGHIIARLRRGLLRGGGTVAPSSSKARRLAARWGCVQAALRGTSGNTTRSLRSVRPVS